MREERGDLELWEEVSLEMRGAAGGKCYRNAVGDGRRVLQKCSGAWARGLTSGSFDCGGELLEFWGGGGITRLFQPAVHVRMLQKYSGGVACENVTKIQWRNAGGAYRVVRATPARAQAVSIVQLVSLSSSQRVRVVPAPNVTLLHRMNHTPRHSPTRAQLATRGLARQHSTGSPLRFFGCIHRREELLEFAGGAGVPCALQPAVEGGAADTDFKASRVNLG